jgi:SAM-dependent methyltransferase
MPKPWEAWDREWSQSKIDAIWNAKHGKLNEVFPTEVARRCSALGARSVLEIGCGGGAQYHYLRRHLSFVQYVGVDVSYKMVRAARRLNPGIEFRHADPADLSDADLSVDVVVMLNDLAHQPFWRGERFLYTAARLARKAVFVGFHLMPREEMSPPCVEGSSGAFFENSWSAPWIKQRMEGWGFPHSTQSTLSAEDIFLDFRRSLKTLRANA